MRNTLLRLAGLTLFALPLSAQTADDIIAKYIKTVGGMDRIQAVTTLRRTGKFTGGGGFEAAVLQENKRPNKVREEFSLQGLTGVNAYDGHTGWKIEPWLGDYKEVAGGSLPYSIESGRKGSEDRQKITIEKIEANVPIDDRRFQKPARD